MDATTNAVTSSLLNRAIPSPTLGLAGSFTLLQTVLIRAPPLQVLCTLRDTDTWPLWNSFCPRVAFVSGIPEEGLETGKERWLELGSVFEMDIHMEGDGLVEGSTKSRGGKFEVSVLGEIEKEGKKGWRIGWIMRGYPYMML